MYLLTAAQLTAKAQRILEERGYLVLGRRFGTCSIGDILSGADDGRVPGPLVVIGFTDHAEFMRQHAAYSLGDGATELQLAPEGFACFLKVVAE